jgi:hypothetical protein
VRRRSPCTARKRTGGLAHLDIVDDDRLVLEQEAKLVEVGAAKGGGKVAIGGAEGHEGGVGAIEAHVEVALEVDAIRGEALPGEFGADLLGELVEAAVQRRRGGVGPGRE